MYEFDITAEPITRERARDLLVCSPHRVHTLISDGTLRPIARDADGSPLFSSQDCYDLYRGTWRGFLMRYGPHPRDT